MVIQCIHCSLFSFPTREHDIGLRQVHTSVDWNGVLEVEHGLLPVGRRVLGTSAERQGVVLHIKYNIKVANESLAWGEEERNKRGIGIQRERAGMVCNVCFMLACIETQKWTIWRTQVCVFHVCCMYTMCTCIACDLIMYNVVCAIHMCDVHMIVFLHG